MDGAAPTVARGILEVHGVASSDVGTQLVGGCEDRQELSHGALYCGLRGNLLGHRAQTRRCRWDGNGSRLLREADFGVGGGDGSRERGWDGDFIGGTSSEAATDSVARGLLFAPLPTPLRAHRQENLGPLKVRLRAGQ